MLKPKPNRMSYDELKININNGYIRIPQFQRDFVWSLDDTANLLDSILKRYPIGSFILWITRKRLASVKKLGGVIIADPHENDNVMYVLDGQQRIASLFAVIKGIKHPRKNKELDYKKIFIDLERNLDGEEPIISKIKTERSISVFELLNKDPMDFEDTFDRSLRKKIQDYKKSFDNYEFSTIELRDYSLNAAVEIFTRINTGGTILTLFEIMAAKTYDEGKNFDMQEKYEKFKKELKNKNYDTIRPRNVLDVLALIISGDCTRNEILNLDKDDIINKWDDTIESIKCTIDYFKAFFKITVSEILPYDSLIVPFSYFFYKNKFNNPNKNQTDLLRKYFWNTSLTYRFSSATASKLKSDAERIDLILNNKKPSYDKKVHLDKDGLKELNFSTGNSFCKAILCLYAQQVPESFKYGTKVSLGNDYLRRSNSRNYHHFFPKNYLENKGIGNKNSIINITYINQNENIKDIRDNAPSKYIKEFSKTNSTLEETMKSHLIDDLKDFGVWDDDYEKFLNRRTKRVIDELSKRLSV